MAVIIDASIKGKVKFPTFPNVTNGNQKVNLSRQTAGLIRTISKNSDKIAAARGKIPKIIASTTTKEASQIVRKSSTPAINGLKETAKGIYISNSA
ncbi:MAG: hypothetical protein ACE5EN_08315 [Nitrospinota bacterium]